MSQFTPLPEDGFLVGGALRDALLGRPFRDLDWLVATPEASARAAAEELQGSVFALDEERGHWRVVAGGVTRDYIPLAGALEEDLRARDFTVNALAADLEGRLHDPLGGRSDLRRRLLRMTGREALAADLLRLLRAVRLAAELDFRLDEETMAAVAGLAAEQAAGELPLPAWERAREELDRLLLSVHAGRGLLLLENLGLLEVYLPELAAGRSVSQGGFHHLDVLQHQLEALNQLVQGFPEADLALRWATLLHDLGKPETRSADDLGRTHFYGHAKLGAELAARLLKRLRLPGERTARVAGLIRYHMLPLPRTDREARRFVHRRRELLPDLLKLMIADREAARGPLSSEAARRAYRLALARAIRLLAEEPEQPPLLTGREVMALLVLPPGPRVGEALRFLREARAVGDIADPEEAVAALRRYAEAQGWTSAPEADTGRGEQD